jgi:adenine-specific DNA-methyltransferase
MDEVFGEANFVVEIAFAKTSSSTGDHIAPTFDRVIWFAKRKESLKFRPFMMEKKPGAKGGTGYRNARSDWGARRPLTSEEMSGNVDLPAGWRVYFRDNLTSQSMGRTKGEGAASWFPVSIDGQMVRHVR